MADAKNDIVLSIRGMSKSFGRNRVLDHIDLDVRRGTVMGLMGENGAGKSTRMKCLFGTYQKDEGKIFLNGKEISFSGPKDALENGIAMVHQELNQCLERNVTDNLFLGRYPTNAMGVVDEGGMKKKASELFRKLGMTVNLNQPMRNMSVSQRQMCEIAKAISYNSQVIVLDEPTSSLTVQEVEKLFEMMRPLAEVEEATLEEGMVKQHNLVQPSNRPVTRDTFYKSIDEPGFIGNIKVGFQPKARLKSVLPNKLIQKIKSL